MSDEMKLIMALCDALGFEVDIAIDRKERKETKSNAMLYNRGAGFGHIDRVLGTAGFDGELDIDEDGMYTSYLRNPVISYKLKKKEIAQTP